MRVLLTLLFSLLSAPLLASDMPLPALYDVSGVAPDDTLNVRALPDANAEIIGTLQPTTANIEMIRTNPELSWGMINLGERSGWVSLKFMQRVAGQWQDGIPRPATCFGTEPFWSFSTTENGGTWATPAQTAPFRLGAGLSATARRNIFGFTGTKLSQDGVPILEEQATVIMRKQICLDGMSDRQFGLSVDVFFNQRNFEYQHELLTGCCSLQP